MHEMRQSMSARPTEAGRVGLEQIAAKTGDLPALPTTALRALQMTKDPQITTHEFQAVISQDQALSARILRIVNSPLYSLRHDVSTLSHAVAILGMETVRSIIMAASIQQFSDLGMRRAGGLAAKLMGDHSWGAAVAARIIARHAGYGNLEEAFLCGLMHDLGKPAMLSCLPEKYLPIVNDVYRGVTTFHKSEMSSFGFSHAHVGALLAEKWNFPAQLSEAIGYHHDPLSAPDFTKLASATSLSNHIMIFLEIGFERNKLLKLEELPEVDFLKLNRAALDSIIGDIQASRKQSIDHESIGCALPPHKEN